MDPTVASAPTPPTPDDRCTCAYRRKRGKIVRIVDPRCPEHGHRGHLKLVP